MSRVPITVKVQRKDIDQFFETAINSPWVYSLKERYLSLPRDYSGYSECSEGVEFFYFNENHENPGYDRWVSYHSEINETYQKFDHYRSFYWSLVKDSINGERIEVSDAVELSKIYEELKHMKPFDLKVHVGSGLKLKKQEK